MKFFLSLVLSLFFYSTFFAQSGQKVFDNSIVHELRIEFDTVNYWNILLMQNAYSQSSLDINFKNLYLPANIVIDSDTIKKIGIRIKGRWTSEIPISYDKKPFKIDFNYFVQDQKYDGLKKINVNNSICDPTYMHDFLSYNIFDEASIIVPRVSFTKVYINDDFKGIYYFVEEIDKTFLKENFGSNSGNLFKAIDNADLNINTLGIDYYKKCFSLETNELINEWSRLVDFINIANKYPSLSNENYVNKIDSIFDVNNYLKIIAIDMLLGNGDSYTYGSKKNYYLYDEPIINKFIWIPWDYDLCLGYHNVKPVVLTNNSSVLLNNILKRPVYLKIFIEEYRNILKSNFTEERLFVLIDSIKHLLNNYVKDDTVSFNNYDMFISSISHESHTFFSSINYQQLFELEKIDSLRSKGQTIDTSESNVIDYFIDSIIIKQDTIRYLSITKSVEWPTFGKINLKDYISQRINEAPIELAKIIIPEEPNEIYDLLNKTDFVLYPNPCKDFIFVSGINNENAFKIEFFDMSGNKVYESENSDFLSVINLINGVYVVKITQNEQVFIKKIRKE